MKFILLLAVLFSSFTLFSQDPAFSDNELKQKLDSVLAEANLLYKYEKSAWVSTDLALANSEIKENFGGYLTYDESNVIKTVILDKENKNSIALYSFFYNFNKPSGISTGKKKLDDGEKHLLNIKNAIINQLGDPKYEIGVPQGYNLNLILIPAVNQYKLYIITGTSQSNIIPFGNDYIFTTDIDGNIQSWNKFHSRLIPAQTSLPSGEKVISVVHSHLKTSPLISATDICTFKLYAPLYGLEEFSVYSPAIGKYMVYNITTDTITVK